MSKRAIEPNSEIFECPKICLLFHRSTQTRLNTHQHTARYTTTKIPAPTEKESSPNTEKKERATKNIASNAIR